MKQCSGVSASLAEKVMAGLMCREGDSEVDEDEGLSLRPGPVASLPQRPKLAEPATPAGQTEPLPAFKRGQLSTTSGSVSSIADTPAVSPAPSRVRFRYRRFQVPYRA